MTGLSENTTYTFSIATVCDSSDTSSFITVPAITTPCDVVNNTYSEVINSCNSYTWNVTGLSYTSSGTYRDTLPQTNGCDFIFILDLTITN